MATEAQHAYGSSLCGTIDRRHFVIVFCSVMAALAIARIVGWIMMSNLVAHIFGWTIENAPGCSGIGCYEVFTCNGMKAATQNWREPLSTLTGAVAFSFGVWGAAHLYRSVLQLTAIYTIFSASLHLCLFLADLVYHMTCHMYSFNMVYSALLWKVPLLPITRGSQDQLREMSIYPNEDVVRITTESSPWFNALVWYIVVALGWTLFLFYCGNEIRRLGMLAERGPLGLGVHYGLDQWNEVLAEPDFNHLLERDKKVPSRFIDDAKLPEYTDHILSAKLLREKERLGYCLGPGDYGAVADGHPNVHPMHPLYIDQQRRRAEDEYEKARVERELAEKELQEALEAAQLESQVEHRDEEEGEAAFQKQLATEQDEFELKAEEAAQEAAEQAQNDAEGAGEPLMVAKIKAAVAYQQELARQRQHSMWATDKSRREHVHASHLQKEDEQMRQEVVVTRENVAEERLRIAELRLHEASKDLHKHGGGGDHPHPHTPHRGDA